MKNLKSLLLIAVLAISWVSYVQAVTESVSTNTNIENEVLSEIDPANDETLMLDDYKLGVPLYMSQPGLVVIIQGKQDITVVSRLNENILINVWIGGKLVTTKQGEPHSSTFVDIPTNYTKLEVEVIGDNGFYGVFQLTN